MPDNISLIASEAFNVFAFVCGCLGGAWVIYFLQHYPRIVILGMLESKPDETRKLSAKIFYVSIATVLSGILALGFASTVEAYQAYKAFFSVFFILWLPMMSGIYKAYTTKAI